MDVQNITAAQITAPIAAALWSAAECWVWERVVSGQVADFHDRDGPLHPKHAIGWAAHRSIRPEFLETILLHEPYRGQLKRQGVRISGVWVNRAIDLGNAVLAHDLILDTSRIECEAKLIGLRTPYSISFQNSFLVDGIDATAANIGHLKFSHAYLHTLKLISAEIKGDLDLDHATCTGLLNMDGVQVNGCLTMNAIDSRSLRLLGAVIGRQLQVDGATFTETVDMRGIKVGEDVYMEGRARFAKLDLTGARIDGQLSLSNSVFAGELSLNSASIGETLYMTDNASFFDVDMSRARLGQSLLLKGSLFRGRFKLTSAVIKDELQLTDEKSRVRWGGNASLILRGAEVATVGASFDKDSWPPELELGGFTYLRWRELEHGETSSNVEWLINSWLRLQAIFNRQPYQQVATMLHGIGYGGLANDVLYACQERERHERAKGLRKFGLNMLKVTIGYGYGYRIFLSLGWVFVLALIGAAALNSVHTVNRFTAGQLFVVSLSQLLPIVELDKALLARALAEFHPGQWQQYLFYLLKVVGYVLGGFVVAGLAGITKR